eukprot:7087028-Heterocapsa_arctica.AAC.1
MALLRLVLRQVVERHVVRHQQAHLRRVEVRLEDHADNLVQLQDVPVCLRDVLDGMRCGGECRD